MASYYLPASEYARFQQLAADDANVCTQLESLYGQVATLMAQHLNLCRDMAGIQFVGKTHVQLGQHTLTYSAADPLIDAAIEPLRPLDATLLPRGPAPYRIAQIQQSALDHVSQNLSRVVGP